MKRFALSLVLSTALAARSDEPVRFEGGAGPLRPAVEAGRATVEAFFGRPFPKPFTVEGLPNRAAMDRVFAERWKMPKSECWMVAAGVADRLYVLAPEVWKTEACEHASTDAHVREIVTHELVHVFHGQHAPNPEFDGMDDLGWFVEGLATYASGQLAGGHAADAAAAIAAGEEPKRLAEAWSGKWRYGVCGSMVRFVERRHGRGMLDRLLRAGTNAEALKALGSTEEEFLAAWRKDVVSGAVAK